MIKSPETETEQLIACLADSDESCLPELLSRPCGRLRQMVTVCMADKPIAARPPTVLQRAGKWSRRNKPLVTWAAIILLLLSIGLAISNWMIDALGKLASEDAAAADLAKLRLFAGLTVDDAASTLGIPRTSGFRQWTYARAFLQAELSGG